MIMLMWSNEMKQRQRLLCQLSGLTPVPARFLEAAASSEGCVVPSLACRWPDAFQVLLYLIGSLESEAWKEINHLNLPRVSQGTTLICKKEG